MACLTCEESKPLELALRELMSSILPRTAPTPTLSPTLNLIFLAVPPDLAIIFASWSEPTMAGYSRSCFKTRLSLTLCALMSIPGLIFSCLTSVFCPQPEIKTERNKNSKEIINIF
jgi:hypothetical protein